MRINRRSHINHRNVMRRCLILAVALTAVSAAGQQLAPGRALAYWDYCRTDPIVRLSDGTLLQMHASIVDTASDVQSVSYTVHAPAGVTLSGVTYTGGPLTAKESVTLVNDMAPGVYADDTLVRAAAEGASVTITAKIPGAAQASASGWTNQTISAVVTG